MRGNIFWKFVRGGMGVGGLSGIMGGVICSVWEVGGLLGKKNGWMRLNGWIY